MRRPIEREVLHHDAVQRILNAHDVYIRSEGKQGVQADLGAYIIADYDFSGLDLSGINTRESVFTRCRFVRCMLYGTYFSGSSLTHADFTSAMLSKAEFYDVDASAARFDGAVLVRAEFIGATLRATTFRHADLHSATISSCDLTDAVFDGAGLEYAAVDDNVDHGTSWLGVRGRRPITT